MLLPRPSTIFDAGLPATPAPWRDLLANDEQSFLTDNQLSVFVDPQHPGCERIHFYPLPFQHRFTGGAWNFEELVNHDSLRSSGPRLETASTDTRLRFQPHVIEKTMQCGEAAVEEHSAVSGNTLVVQWHTHNLPRSALGFALPYFAAQAEAIPSGLLIAIRGEVFVALVLAGAQSADFTSESSPFQCRAELALPLDATLTLTMACGYERESTVAAAQAALADPAAIFAAAERTWDDYFTRIVPHFACSDRALERLYYYQAYTTRANLYDIPYAPWTQPYTCPWKTGAVWQWSWNTPMNSICERWLNDKHIGAGGILLEADNGGALNIGSYIHPLHKVTDLRSHNEHMAALGRRLKSISPDEDLIPLTTLPHTAPNGLLGAWEFYQCSGDREFLRRALALMVEAEREFSRHELPNGLCTCHFVDEFDYSLRLKPFIRGFVKGDPEMMLKMDSPFVAIDYNCWLYALRERIISAVAVLKTANVDANVDVDVDELSARNARLKEAINQHLWNEADGFYYDAHPATLQHSGVKCIAGFAPLYAGIADARRAARLVAHLTNPAEFGTPYPCPSISMDTPGVDPSLITYGGDSMMTSGVWCTVEGLARYGYTDLAAQYVLKAIEMVNQEGPSSSYSYHSMTGAANQPRHTLAAQCAILTDLIVKYVIGLRPTPDGTLQVLPLPAAQQHLHSFTFGPYRYRDQQITVHWDATTGYEMSRTG
jgi:hypothetical protein